ncbi:hypothetical protein IWZ03DRAFT_61213 [Phyllosticta citriasiana]|uniref:Uncharacterized protein n=1 Tax=Phyllosticta citriasiana TaxID=595635 RepID=A0ABR1KDI2_9PEZI
MVGVPTSSIQNPTVSRRRGGSRSLTHGCGGVLVCWVGSGHSVAELIQTAIMFRRGGVREWARSFPASRFPSLHCLYSILYKRLRHHRSEAQQLCLLFRVALCELEWRWRKTSKARANELYPVLARFMCQPHCLSAYQTTSNADAFGSLSMTLTMGAQHSAARGPRRSSSVRPQKLPSGEHSECIGAEPNLAVSSSMDDGDALAGGGGGGGGGQRAN